MSKNQDRMPQFPLLVAFYTLLGAACKKLSINDPSEAKGIVGKKLDAEQSAEVIATFAEKFRAHVKAEKPSKLADATDDYIAKKIDLLQDYCVDNVVFRADGIAAVLETKEGVQEPVPEGAVRMTEFLTLPASARQGKRKSIADGWADAATYWN